MQHAKETAQERLLRLLQEHPEGLSPVEPIDRAMPKPDFTEAEIKDAFAELNGFDGKEKIIFLDPGRKIFLTDYRNTKPLPKEILEKIKKAILLKARGKGILPEDLLRWFDDEFLPKVRDVHVKSCLLRLASAQKIALAPDLRIYIT